MEKEKNQAGLAVLLGEPLDDFSLREYTEVYTVSDDGRKTESKGFLKDENVAKAVARNQPDANWHKTEKAIILTDGNIGFLIGKQITFMDDEKEALEAREKALEKLSAEDIIILKLFRVI